jgi:hypothetical protein
VPVLRKLFSPMPIPRRMSFSDVCKKPPPLERL